MNEKEAEKLLNSDKQLLIESYFELQEAYEKNYGENTIILLELGSFFESYEVDNSEEKLGKAKEISEILNIQLTRKNKNIKEITRKNCYMAGVPTVSLDKHLNKLISTNKYTIVLIKQAEKPVNNKFPRYISDIISPGTNFNFLNEQDFNFLSSVIIEEYKGVYEIGYSAIDITTGNIILNETISLNSDKLLSLDFLNILLSTYDTKELVLTIDTKVDKQKLFKHLQLTGKSFHLREKRIKNNYQNDLFKEVFKIETFLSSIEYLNLENKPLASESLAILIDFVLEHDSNLLNKIKIPTITEPEKNLYLGNNALEQLNIKDFNNQNSIFNIINKTKTSIGRRALKDRLYSPIKDQKELNRRYSLSLDIETVSEELSSYINSVYDIERLFRRIQLLRIHPFEINYFYYSLESIKKSCLLLKNNKINGLNKINCSNITKILEEISKYINLELSDSQSINNINKNFINKGIDNQIDKLVKDNESIYFTLQSICNEINNLFDGDNKFCKLEKTQQEGFFLSLTNSKYKLLKETQLSYKFSIKNKKYSLKKDFNISKLTNSVKIKGDLVNKLSDRYLANTDKISSFNKKIFYDFCSSLTEKFENDIQEAIYFIGDIDVALSNLVASQTFNLTKPNILDFNQQSYIESEQLRHIIVEKNEENGIFIPNNIVLGNSSIYNSKISCVMNEDNKTTEGALLYGINSSGKSTLLKSVGVAIILAQAGLFVPAKQFNFTLFDSLFSRIQGNDNIYKGLSSFTVEMMELKNIFNRANEKSLILGDELSHSTETISGLSIVASSLMKFFDSKSLFMLATHLHQLPEIEQLSSLKNLHYFHLATNFDSKSNTIQYDRTIKNGKGSSIYGLEFATALELDSKFLKNADIIRKKIADDYSNIERLNFNKTSKYNSKKIRTKCQICDEVATETHHLKEQSEFKDNFNFKDNIKKNHKYNLVDLCNSCHKKIHSFKYDGDIHLEYIQTSRGIKLYISNELKIYLNN